jgi:hypothetical protein
MINDVSGPLIVATGAIGLFASRHYEIGTLTNMGPGLFPMSLSFLLIILGLIITVKSYFETDSKVNIRWKSLIVIPTSIVFFGIALNYAGLVIATSILVFISTIFTALKLKQRFILSIMLSLINYIVFVLVLHLPIRIF